MAHVEPFQALRFDPDVVQLGGVLAPPYDVISPTQQEALYARDLRNMVRIELGQSFADDVPEVNDRYTRAAGHLQAWQRLGILLRDTDPSFYVSEHQFTDSDGTMCSRRGFFARVLALPWAESELLPHERTLTGPKEDRRQLLRATQTQISPVFAIWDQAEGARELIDQVCAQPAAAGGRTEGELGSEKHLLWTVSDPPVVEALRATLGRARLFIADGHHRYETAAAYATERQGGPHEGGGPTDSQYCLAYLCAADDPALRVLPTHRLVRPRPGLPRNRAELIAALAASWTAVEVDDLAGALRAQAIRRSTHHAFAVVTAEDATLLVRPRRTEASPRANLDVTVLEEEFLTPLGLDAAAISGGALGYTRHTEDLVAAVGRDEAAIGIALNPTDTADVLAVAGAGEVMPQKSTYFYPKVPTGLVMSPI